MQKLAGIVASLAVGFLMTAAGLAMEIKELTIAGIVLLGLAAVLWLVGWGKGAKKLKNSSTRDQSVTSHDQSGGITAHQVSLKDD